MELGVLYDLRNPPSSGIPNEELYAETLDHIATMEALGFDVVWLTEHHFIDDSYLPATLTMAAAVAASRSAQPCCCCRCTTRCTWPRRRRSSTS